MIKLIIKQYKEFIKLKKSHVFFFMLLGMLSTMAIFYITMILPKEVMDLIQSGNQQAMFTKIGIYTSILIISGIILNYSNVIVSVNSQEVRLLQFARFHKKYTEIDYEYIEDSDFQDRTETSSRALGGNNSGFEHVYTVIYTLLKGIVVIGVAIYVMLNLSYWVVLASIFAAITAMIIKNMIAKNEYKNKDNVSHEARKQNYFYHTSYNFNYGKDMRVYQLQDSFMSKYKVASKNYLSVLKKLYNFEFMASLLEVIPLLLQDAVAFIMIAYAYTQNQISISEVAMYLSSVVILSTHLREFGMNFGLLRSDLRYVKDFYSFMEDTSYTHHAGDMLPLKEDITIVFEHVDFKYPKSETYIYKDLNLTITSREKLAIVGINGAGKTTLVKLMCGLFYPTSGRILINGHDIRLFDKKKYQDMFSVVFQDYKVFAASVLENVMGLDDQKFKAIEALNRAGIEEKVRSLPHQYEQQLLRVTDDEGIDLSGGEKQKIAIARALYKDAPVMILDEPTSALDAIAEEEIYKNFSEMTKNKTTVFISHRLASTRFCDKIALFDKGLIEYGTHEELMNKKGIYYDMFQTQGKYYKEDSLND